MATFVALFIFVACSPNDPSKAAPAAPKSTAATDAKPEPKKEEHHTPDTHGMPGMSELFKGDDKAAEKTPEKAPEKAATKPDEKK